jgi:hypothetical protein
MTTALGAVAVAGLGGGIAITVDDDGDGDGDSGEYNIVGVWPTYNRYADNGDLIGDGEIVFSGNASSGTFTRLSGTFTRLNSISHRTYHGNYIVQDGLVTMTDDEQVWTGTFTDADTLGGTWHLVNNSEERGDWGAWR